MAKPIKRAKKPKAERTPGQDGIIKIRLGTPNELGPDILVPTEGEARKRMSAHFSQHRLWASLHNRAALPLIDEAVVAVNGTAVTHTRARVTCRLDDYTNFTLAAEVWRES